MPSTGRRSVLFSAAASAAIAISAAYSDGRPPHYHQRQHQQRVGNSATSPPWHEQDHQPYMYSYSSAMARESGAASFGDNYHRPTSRRYGNLNPPQGDMDRIIQGNSRRSYNAYGQRTEIHLGTIRGNPMFTNVEMWDGPSNTANSMRVWSEDGRQRPFQATVESGYYDDYGRQDVLSGGNYRTSSSVDVRNEGTMEYPVNARVQPQISTAPGYRAGTIGGRQSRGETIQGGGAVRHFQLHPSVSSVRINIHSVDGTPVKALVELLQGPGRVAQLAEVYNQHGRQWEGVVQTPGYGSTVAITNKGPLEYPLMASVEPVTFEGSNNLSNGFPVGGNVMNKHAYVSGGNYGRGGSGGYSGNASGYYYN